MPLVAERALRHVRREAREVRRNVHTRAEGAHDDPVARAAHLYKDEELDDAPEARRPRGPREEQEVAAASFGSAATVTAIPRTTRPAVFAGLNN